MTNPAPTSFYQNTIVSGFQAVYLGPFATAPTLDNFGNALVVGQLYFNTTTNTIWVWTGTVWLPFSGIITGGFQTVSTSTATLAGSLVTVTIAAGTTLTLPAAPGQGQHLWIKGGVTLTGAVISAAANVVPLNSATPGTAIIAISGKFAHLVFDGVNWQTVAGA
jgi:hypothetical protein